MISRSLTGPPLEAPTQFSDWSPEQFEAAVNRRLKKEGAGQLKDGHYYSYIVIMHTDELSLTPVQSLTGNCRFERPENIGEVFVIVSYHPNHGCCVVPVLFKNKSAGLTRVTE